MIIREQKEEFVKIMEDSGQRFAEKYQGDKK